MILRNGPTVATNRLATERNVTGTNQISYPVLSCYFETWKFAARLAATYVEKSKEESKIPRKLSPVVFRESLQIKMNLKMKRNCELILLCENFISFPAYAVAVERLD